MPDRPFDILTEQGPCRGVHDDLADIFIALSSEMRSGIWLISRTANLPGMVKERNYLMRMQRQC